MNDFPKSNKLYVVITRIPHNDPSHQWRNYVAESVEILANGMAIINGRYAVTPPAPETLAWTCLGYGVVNQTARYHIPMANVVEIYEVGIATDW